MYDTLDAKVAVLEAGISQIKLISPNI
jgi:hypothetical protein